MCVCLCVCACVRGCVISEQLNLGNGKSYGTELRFRDLPSTAGHLNLACYLSALSQMANPAIQPSDLNITKFYDNISNVLVLVHQIRSQGSCNNKPKKEPASNH